MPATLHELGRGWTCLSGRVVKVACCRSRSTSGWWVTVRVTAANSSTSVFVVSSIAADRWENSACSRSGTPAISHFGVAECFRPWGSQPYPSVSVR